MTPLETSIYLNHSFKMGIAIRIPEGSGRKPGRRPGSDPEVETDSANPSWDIPLGFQAASIGSRKASEGFPEGSRKIPGRFPEVIAFASSS